MGYSSKFLFIFSLLLSFTSAQASLLVLETTNTPQPSHSETVSSIACEDNNTECDVQITDFSTDFLTGFIDDLEAGDVVNMSFGYQRADEDIHAQMNFEALQAQGFFVQDYTEVYDEREALFKSMIESKNDTLFVAAAGNGAPLSSMLGANGVPLGPLNKIYPAVFEYDNLIKVTSANVESFNLSDRVEYEIPDYANYSTDFVDVAAPVEVDQEGTSFAAPYVSRLGKTIKEEVDYKISPKELKEVFRKSCYVQSLDKTIELFSKYKEEPRTSLIGRVQNMALSYSERREVIDSIRPVMLVKCGGVISSEVAKACAASYIEREGKLSISEACLGAQSKQFKLNQEELLKLQEFWNLQGI